VHVTDAVALFPRFPHLMEAGRIELPLAVHPLRSPTALTCRPLFADGLHPLGMQFII